MLARLESVRVKSRHGNRRRRTTACETPERGTAYVATAQLTIPDQDRDGHDIGEVY